MAAKYHSIANSGAGPLPFTLTIQSQCCASQARHISTTSCSAERRAVAVILGHIMPFHAEKHALSLLKKWGTINNHCLMEQRET